MVNRGTDESTLGNDESICLRHHDPSVLGSSQKITIWSVLIFNSELALRHYSAGYHISLDQLKTGVSFHRLIKAVSYPLILELHFKDHPTQLAPSDYRARQVPRDLEVYREVKVRREQPVILVLLVRRDHPGLLVPAGSEALKDSMDHRAQRGIREHLARKVPRDLLGYMILAFASIGLIRQ